MAKNRKDGIHGNSIYLPEFHPQNCIELGKEGKFLVEMAKEWETSTKIINDWIKKHMIFRYAYARSCNYRTAYYIKLARENVVSDRQKQISHQILSLLLRYDGQHVDERPVVLNGALSKKKTNEEKSIAILQAFDEGKLSPKELQAAMGALKIAVDIADLSDIKQRLDQLEMQANGEICAKDS
jgi:hypothetical protein